MKIVETSETDRIHSAAMGSEPGVKRREWLEPSQPTYDYWRRVRLVSFGESWFSNQKVNRSSNEVLKKRHTFYQEDFESLCWHCSSF